MEQLIYVVKIFEAEEHLSKFEGNQRTCGKTSRDGEKFYYLFQGHLIEKLLQVTKDN